jgi:uncharacterized integral membrane protein (TIGR00698 family)
MSHAAQSQAAALPHRTPGPLAALLIGRPLVEMPTLLPGVLFAGAVVALAMLTADTLNTAFGYKGLVSYIMMAIVLGIIAGNVVTVPRACAPGLAFCLTKLLRVGIILMGFRMSLLDAARIGAWGIPIIVICISTGLITSAYFTRLLKLPARLGTLLAVGTSICGATAIVATAPAIQADEQEVAYAVANITVFGILAMLLYPYLAHLLFDGNAIMAGLFQGTAIHETAQVTGAALIYDQTFGATGKPTAGDIAIVTKLVRNVFIAGIVPLAAWAYARRTRVNAAPGERVSAWRLFPLFILGFIAMAALRSIGDAGMSHGGIALGRWSATQWTHAIGSVSDSAGYALAMSMSAVGVNTRLATLKGLGVKPFYAGLITAAVVGIASTAAVYILGRYVTF